jgi:hypothetical protein
MYRVMLELSSELMLFIAVWFLIRGAFFPGKHVRLVFGWVFPAVGLVFLSIIFNVASILVGLRRWSKDKAPYRGIVLNVIFLAATFGFLGYIVSLFKG